MTDTRAGTTDRKTLDMLLSDTPVRHPDQDGLRRASFAKQLAESILALDASDGFVFALNGPWGSGKTTVIHFVLHYLNELKAQKQVVVVQFNPWWFSTKEQLLLRFFRELRASLGKKDVPQELQNVAEMMGRLGTLIEPLSIIPFAGQAPGILSRAFHAIGSYLQNGVKANAEDVFGLRLRIDKELRKQKAKIVVVIDDIDRLSADEIREVFQLVKSVADFPNTIYLLSFDRGVVASSLDKIQGGTGNDYIEKIVQVPFDLPPIDRISLRRYFICCLEPILADMPNDLWSGTEWGNIYLDGIDSFLETIRDVKRLTNLLQCSYPLVKGEVRPAEFVAIQTLRLFAPDIFNAIHAHKTQFAGIEPWERAGVVSKHEEKKKYAESILALAPESLRDSTNKLLERLFPLWASAFGGACYGGDWLGRWRKECRVCSPDVLDRYLMLGIQPDDVSNKEMRRILDLAADTDAFEKELLRLSKVRRPDGVSQVRTVLERMEDYTREDIPAENMPNILRALFSIGDQLSDKDEERGPFDQDTVTHVARVAYQLVSRFKTQEERFAHCRAAIAKNNATFFICQFVEHLGFEHGKLNDTKALKPEAERMVGIAHLNVLESLAVDSVEKAASEKRLHQIPRLAAVLYAWADWKGEDKPKAYVKDLIRTDEGLADCLSGFLSQMRSWGMGDRVTKSQWRIDPKAVQRFVDVSIADLKVQAESILKQNPNWLNSQRRLALETIIHNAKPGDR